MTSPIDRETLPPAGEATKLPALPSPNQAPDTFLHKVKETLEVMLGRRGQSKWDQVVTFRDLYGAASQINTGNGFGLGLVNENDDALGMATVVYGELAKAIEQRIRSTAAFKTLMTRIGSQEDLAGLPDEIRMQLEIALEQVAKERRADIQTVERKIQNSVMSMASRMTEVTASLDQNLAGVRDFEAAYADRTKAVALSVTQVTARIDDVDGAGVTIEEKFLAQADEIAGLLGQWSVKIVAGTAANPVIAGIALSAEVPEEGPSTTAFVILADQFALFTSGGNMNPFSVSGSTVTINGDLRVNGGTKLADIEAGSKRMVLAASSQVFQVAKDGTISPASISLVGVPSNLTGSPTWTITSGTATLTAGGTAWLKSLTYANMGTDSVTIRITQDGQYDEITIVKVREGADSITAFLTNEAHTVPSAADGTGGVFTGAATTMKVYKGAVDDSANWTFSRTNGTGVTSSIVGDTVTVTAMTNDTGYVDLTAARTGYTSIVKRFTLSKSKTGTAGTNGTNGTNAKQLYLGATSQVFRIAKDGTATPSSITLTATEQNLAAGTPSFTIPSGTATLTAGGTSSEKVLTYANLSTDTATIQVAKDGLTDQITIVKVREGDDGITSVLSNEAHTLSADNSGTVLSYSGASTTMKVYKGVTDDSANWTFSRTDGTGVTSTISTNTVTVTALAAGTDTSYVDITAARTGFASITKRFTLSKSKTGAAGTNGTNGSNGSDGQRGSLDIAVSGYSGFSGLTDSDANSIFLSATGFWRQERDRMTLYNGSTSETRAFVGGTWVALAAYINGNMVVTGTFSADKITTGTLSADRVSGGTLTGMNINIASQFTITVSGGTATTFIAAPTIRRATCDNNDTSGLPAVTATSAGAGAAVKATAGSGAAIHIDGSMTSVAYSESSNKSTQTNNCIPISDNTYNLGTIAKRWMGITSATAVSVVSDRREKIDIKESDLGLGFINSLRPVSYRLRVGHNEIEHEPELEGPLPDGRPQEKRIKVIPVEGTRRHYGLIAQEVRKALGTDDTAIWLQGDKNDPDSMQALRYEELIGPLIKAVQELAAENAALRADVDKLLAKQK